MDELEGKTPAEIAAMPPVEVAKEPTPAEIAMEGLKPPQEASEASEATPPPETPQDALESPEEALKDVKETEPRYNTQLQALMAKARESREKQVSNQQYEEQRQYLEKIEMAKQLGPDAALKALGIERQKIDIAKLLNPEQHDEEPKSVRELKEQVAQINQYIEDLRQSGEAERQRLKQEQSVQWEKNELAQISQFIDSSKDKYEYVEAAKGIGSDKDIYNGLISMYNQGYSPSYDEMSDVVEARIEQLIELLAPTKKFSDYIAKRFGAQTAPQGAGSVTLTDGMKGEPSNGIDFASLSDEDNRKHAMQQAITVQQDLLRKLGRA